MTKRRVDDRAFLDDGDDGHVAFRPGFGGGVDLAIHRVAGHLDHFAPHGRGNDVVDGIRHRPHPDEAKLLANDLDARELLGQLQRLAGAFQIGAVVDPCRAVQPRRSGRVRYALTWIAGKIGHGHPFG